MTEDPRELRPEPSREKDDWLEANREAIDAYNAHVERDGVFSEDLRTF